jgi:CelD/BcsL family acetyltransferase involved in cellulose biosynthesis
MGLLSIVEGAREAGEARAGERTPAHGLAATGPAAAPVIAVESDVEAFLALEADWRALERQTAGPGQVFQSFDWCSAWTRAGAGEPGVQLRIVTARVEGRLVLVWPLMQVRTGPFCVLRWLSDPYSQYGDVLVEAGAGSEPVLAAAWGHIRALPGIDAIRLRHVRADAAVAGFLARHCRPAGAADCAPCLDLTAYRDEAAYDQRYTRTQRRRRRRIRQKLEERGALDFRLLTGGPEFDRLIERVVAEKRAWLAARGLHSRPLADPRLTDFIRQLAAGSDLQVALSVLSAGGEAVAFEIGLRYAQHHFGYITARDARLANTSPARLHTDMSQRRAMADGMRVFDLMVPGDPYKVSWSNVSVPVFDLYAPLTWLGRLYGFGYLEGLRPLMRRAYHAAPPGLRRHSRRLIGG